MLHPADYWGEMLAESSHGKRSGFYPTPMTVTQMMIQMVMAAGPGEGTANRQIDGKDARLKTVCDPCLGTGAMLLAASNHSVCLYGMDIDQHVIKGAMISAALYVPWMVRPFPDALLAASGQTAYIPPPPAPLPVSEPMLAQMGMKVPPEVIEQIKQKKKKIYRADDTKQQGFLFEP